MKKHAIFNLFAIVSISAALGAGCGSHSAAEKTNVSNAPAKVEKTSDSGEAVRAGKIVAAFAKDKDAGKTYRGKILLISGKITNINNVFDQVNINLRENETETGLAAYLKDPADKQKLKVGDEVVIRAVVRDDETCIAEKAEILKIN